MQYTPRRLRLEKQKKKEGIKRQIGRILIVFLIVAGMGALLKQAHSLVMLSKAKSIVVEYGTLEHVISTQAVVARYEQVYTCPITGRIQVVAKEEERVSEGALIAKIKGEGSSATAEMPEENIYAQKAGIVSYKLDGLEQIITPETISNLKAESVYEQAKNAESKVAANQQVVPSGTGFVKIVNNLKPVILEFSLSKDAWKGVPETGDVFTFRLAGEIEARSGQAVEVIRNSTGYRILAEVRDWPQQLLTERLVEMEVLVESFEGIVVPQSAIITRDGVQGVYKVTTNRYVFKPVEIIGQVGESAVVSGLEAGDEILLESARLK